MPRPLRPFHITEDSGTPIPHTPHTPPPPLPPAPPTHTHIPPHPHPRPNSTGFFRPSPYWLLAPPWSLPVLYHEKDFFLVSHFPNSLNPRQGTAPRSGGSESWPRPRGWLCLSPCPRIGHPQPRPRPHAAALSHAPFLAPPRYRYPHTHTHLTPPAPLPAWSIPRPTHSRRPPGTSWTASR